ncbi:Resolvase, N terminal domain [Nocardia otitidiscaviarum]|uniref:Resolvase, N terminal domain n=1 Tax=Nocardia otitidiscaviarum TaxID=1823 RepID=A0A378YI91_9NOCA|nr:recombinase family protein [Nocardia otitidiscaviarum]SUA76864.1 Resolvase, N terminal domain [Nocardia otitidiscaviarum]
MPESPPRALIVIRLSKVTDATTSPERQLAECRAICEKRGYEVVGVAEDLDVSGAVDPFDRKKRPHLARWLHGEHLDDNGEPVPFEVIVVYRVDRLTRSVRHLQKLVAWADDHKKLVVSATEAHFDTSLPFSAVLIALIGTVAEMELAGISERNASAARHNIQAGRYRGSTPPWGYVPSNDTGEWRLVRDKEQADVINEVARRVIEGEPLQKIAHDLTRRGILTPKDNFAKQRGREIKGREWSVTQLKRSLLSEAMLGHAVSGGAAVRNDDGSPVVRSEPILSREIYDRVAAELSSRAKRGEPNKRTSSLLLGVISCGNPCLHKQQGHECPEGCSGTCDEPVYKFNGGSHSQFPRYRCRTMTRAYKCGNRTIRADQADAQVERTILALLGSSERLERVWDAGEDHSAELADINDELVDLTSQLGVGAFRAGTPQRAKLDARIASLAERQAQLSSEAVVPAGWKLLPTGELFGDWWSRQDLTARNVWLRSMGVRARFKRDDKTLYIDLGNLNDLISGLKPGGTAQRVRGGLQAMERNGIQGMVFSDADSEVMPAPAAGYMWIQPVEGVWVYTSEALLAAAAERQALRREKIEDEFAYGPGDFDEDWD